MRKLIVPDSKTIIKKTTMAILSFRIYFTANLLIALLMLITGGFSGDAFSFALMAFVVSMMITIPAGFALYFCFFMIENTHYTIFWRWFCLFFGVFISALIPTSIASGFVNGEMAIPFYLSEGSAFGAMLLNCIAIHRHFKISSDEIF